MYLLGQGTSIRLFRVRVTVIGFRLMNSKKFGTDWSVLRVNPGIALRSIPGSSSPTGGVDDIDFDPLIRDGNVFGENGDASFSFEIVGVENLLSCQLCITELPALAEHAIDECSFAVIDVSDDGNVSEIISGFKHLRRL